MSCEIKPDLSLYLAVFWALVAFGILYNAFVAWLERKGYAEGFMSLIVATGVLVTLVGVSIISIEAALMALGGFVATGTPMIIGSIVRYLIARDRAKRLIIKDLLSDD